MVQPKVPGYTLKSKIGSGSFAEVFKASKVTNQNQHVAIKCIKKLELCERVVNSITTEIKTLKLLKHPNIIQMIDFAWDDNFIYIIMEYCEGGDLSNFIKKNVTLSEKICQFFLHQLASAIEYLRSHNIVHMDLKPQNLLLTSRKNPVLKLTDFGLAQFLRHTEKETSFRGSPLYMAPEILLKQPYDASVDLWSTGIILYECLFGRPPYTSKSLKELVTSITSTSPVVIPQSPEISIECRELLTTLLKKHPSNRLSFEDFFRHPFLLPVSIAVINRRSDDISIYHDQSSTVMNLPINNETGTRNSTVSHVKDEAARYPIEGECVNPNSSATSLNPTPFQELRSLALATPSMLTALEIGVEGIHYDSECKYVLALERYTAALESLITLLRREPKGRRKELLHQQVNLWIERAESLKHLVDTHQSSCESLLADDPGQCSLQ